MWSDAETSERTGFTSFCAESARKDSTPLVRWDNPIGNELMLMTTHPTFSKTSHLPPPQPWTYRMLKNSTRSKMFDMPRRVPSQLSYKRQDTTPRSILRRPTLQQPAKRLGSAPPKRVRFASDVKPSLPPHELPRRVIISSYAVDAYSVLQDILAEKNHDPEAAKNYNSPARTVLPSSDCKKAEEGKQIPVIALGKIHHSPQLPAFPGVKGHRFWRLKPGLYRLIDTDTTQREVLLGVGKSVVRTVLPVGVPGPPEKTNKTFLEIGTPGDGQQYLRVTAKWVQVQTDQHMKMALFKATI